MPNYESEVILIYTNTTNSQISTQAAGYLPLTKVTNIHAVINYWLVAS